MKKYILFLALVSCSKVLSPVAPHTYETDDCTFYHGEILYPDYVHEDTLVVTDAVFLNWLIENYDPASDGDIADCLRVTTKPKPIK